MSVHDVVNILKPGRIVRWYAGDAGLVMLVKRVGPTGWAVIDEMLGLWVAEPEELGCIDMSERWLRDV